MAQGFIVKDDCLYIASSSGAWKYNLKTKKLDSISVYQNGLIRKRDLLVNATGYNGIIYFTGSVVSPLEYDIKTGICNDLQLAGENITTYNLCNTQTNLSNIKYQLSII